MLILPMQGRDAPTSHAHRLLTDGRVDLPELLDYLDIKKNGFAKRVSHLALMRL
jgi:hypothetical protein